MTCEDMAQTLGTDAYAPESPAAYFRECEHAGACLRVALRARVWVAGELPDDAAIARELGCEACGEGE